MTKRAVFVAFALIASAIGLSQGLQGAGADGTETLGAPKIPIQSGTGVAVGGIGTTGKTGGPLTVTVPASVTVKQVLLHWSGIHNTGTAADGTIHVNGVSTKGTKIGGQTYWYKTYEATSYRADVTSRGLVAPGLNSIAISGMSFNVKNDGVGITVIYDDGSGNMATIVLRDGIDLAQRDLPEPRKTTKAQAFTFPSSQSPRTAEFLLHVGDVGKNRPHEVVVTVGGVQTRLVNHLQDGNGQEWDAVEIPITIPAGVTTASIQLVSVQDGSGYVPASIIWVATGLQVPPAITCLPSDTQASAISRAFGVSVALGGSAVIVPTPDTADPAFTGDPALEVDLLGSLDPTAPTIVEDTLFDVEASKTDSPANATATATANNLLVQIPGGPTITASTVVAKSVSSASGTNATSSAAGSTIQDLVIDGALIGDISEPTNITVGGAGAPLVRIDLLERITTGAAAGAPQPEGGEVGLKEGTYNSGLTVNGIHVQIPDLGVDVIVSSAATSAVAPATVGCKAQPHLVGRAFTTYVGAGTIAGIPPVIDPVVSELTGLVILPSTGGTESEHVLQAPPLGVGVGHSNTSGDLAGTNATSDAYLASFDLLGAGVITGEVVRATTSSTATSDSGGATIARLLIAGNDVCSGLGLSAICAPAPNTQHPSPPPGTLIVLNEQISPIGGGITVNAVHLYIVGSDNPLGLPVGAEVILASATSDFVPVA